MKNTISIRIAIAICIFLLAGCGTPPTELPVSTPTILPAEEPAEPTYSNLPYMGDDNPRHMLDIYLPEDAEGGLPTLLMMHGSLDSKEDHKEIGRYFADHGYAVVLTAYQTGVDQHISLGDTLCSLAWVHANSEDYGFDSQHIYLFGYSLGGLFATVLASIDNPGEYMEGCPNSLPKMDWTAGAITFAGFLITEGGCMSPQAGKCMAQIASANKIPLTEMLGIFENLREVPYTEWRDTNDLGEEAKYFAETLPLYWIDGSEPPFLIMHGDMDEMVPVGDSETFASAVQAKGGDVELIILPGAGHFSLSLASPSFEKMADAIEAFISER